MEENRFRMTRQRQVLLEELRSVGTHPTADGIYQMVRRRLPRISLGTVYRNLDVLTRMGLIRALHFSGQPMRFDGSPERHYHVRCRVCGRLDDIPHLPLDDVVRMAGEFSGYDVGECRIEVVGICPKCGAHRERTGKN